MTRATARLAVARPDDLPVAAIPLPAAATQHQLAQYLLHQCGIDAGATPVGADMRLWAPDARGVWRPTTVDRLAVDIGRTLTGYAHARRVGDYRAIAAHMLAIADDPEFFEGGVVGVVCPGGLWTVAPDGEIARVDLRVEHRQRYGLAVDPDIEREPELLRAYLHAAFGPDEAAEQIDLLSEIVGAALVGLAAAMPIVALLLGPGRSGKSTCLRIVRELFPAAGVASVSPYRWDHEYYLAGLAGARLNVVGELPDDHPIPAAALKNVTGGDLLSARHPTHRPFVFRAAAAHLIAANTLPATTDRSDAFFRRWRVVHFVRAVAPEDVDLDLADRIIADELGAVLGWALRGAARVRRRGRLATTRAHDRILQRWRIGSNPVLLHLLDADYCALDAGVRTRASEVYASYRAWANANGNRPMSAQAWGQLVDDTASTVGVTRGRTSTERYVDGVRVVGTASMGLLGR